MKVYEITVGGKPMFAYHKLPEVKKAINMKLLKKGNVKVEMNDVPVEKAPRKKRVAKKK